MLNRIVAGLFLVFWELTSAFFFMVALVVWALTVLVDRRLIFLPVVISSTNAALPKHSLNFHGRQHRHIRMLAPIPVERVANLSVEDLTELVRTLVASQPAEMTPA